MTLEEFVVKAIEIGTLAGRIFLRLHQATVEDQDASGLFEKMAAEEEDYTAILNRQLCQIRIRPDAFLPIHNVARTRQQAFMEMLRVISQVISQKISDGSLDLEEAIEIGLQVDDAAQQIRQVLMGLMGLLYIATRTVNPMIVLKNPEYRAGLLGVARKQGMIPGERADVTGSFVG
jgi:hypothetical protein